MRTVLSPSGAYVCPYHRGNNNLKIGIQILKVFQRYGMEKQEKR